MDQILLSGNQCVEISASVIGYIFAYGTLSILVVKSFFYLLKKAKDKRDFERFIDY